MNWRTTWVVLSVLCLGSSGAGADMTFAAYDSSVHDRFDSASFLGAGLDWTGVGKSGGSWATLISPNKFISANHAHPGIGSTVTFWTSNSSAGGTETATVSGGARVGTTDLWVGTFSSALPSSVTTYDVAGALIPDISTGLGAYANELVYMVGTKGVNGFAVGQNRYDASDATPPINGTFDAIGAIFDESGATNFVAAHEALVQPGDSGAPSFVVDGGELKLVGIHSFYADEVTSGNFLTEFDYRTPESLLFVMTPERAISFDNFVPSYVAQISAVPEPSAFVLVTVATIIAFRWRRR